MTEKEYMNQTSDAFPYEDIVSLPHHISGNHPHMTRQDRAAQFSPFAALTGYYEAVSETARLTERKRELSEEEDRKLNQELDLLEEHIAERPEIRVEYFVPDEKKAGGRYEIRQGRIRRIDRVNRILVFTDETVIGLDDVSKIEVKKEQ